MMFSSRIIKGAALERQQIAGYFFEPLHEESQVRLAGDEGGFQQLFSGHHGFSAEPAGHAPAAHSPEGEQFADDPGYDQDELQRMLQDASDRGFADGRREAEESFSSVCRSLSEAIAAIDGLRERIIRESEEDLLRLAMLIAKQIIRQEISQDRKILASFVSEAVSGISDQNEIVICFHPEDYRAVSACRQNYLAGIGDKLQITLKPDDSITIGGCVVDTQTGQVDARVETQLAEIFKRLMQERGNAGDVSIEQPTEAELLLAKHSGVEKYGSQRD